MRYKAVTVICGILLLCGSCRLAREDGVLNNHEDRLVGVFITTEHLDLFDFDGYVNDNLTSFWNGGVIIDNHDKYQGRLYAALITRPSTQEDTGEALHSAEYVFEGIEGIALYSPTITGAENSYISTVSGEGIQSHMGINFGDEEDILTLEGTIHTIPADLTLYFNPVYQSADGRVYLISGSGMGVSSGVYYEGDSCSQTITQDLSSIEKGKAKKYSCLIKISVKFKFPPEKFVVMQMNADSALLSRDTYIPGDAPEVFTAHPDMAYLIVETYKRDDMGKLRIEREIYGAEAGSFATYFVRDDGVCIGQLTQIGHNRLTKS